ncbi:hypothetical protein 2 [Beihai weivirus-like virus 15]|uniref:hypothetical protein 2 n=1 Tax=Beihai weivirus-like virus 15 TaxID=1922743 RepID=UPI00090A52B4|nr:hypothetical protein 2 [Beihai weivirus-like virus 15]APG78117.1 hypothetical protein 2 [Beihai weivirus-like virus 15]
MPGKKQRQRSQGQGKKGAGKGQPPQKKKPSGRPQRGQKAAPAQDALHGHIYSPWDPRPVPSIQYEGPATSLTTRKVSFASPTTATSVVVCIATTGHSATIGLTMTDAATPFVNTLDGNFASGSATAGGPTSGRSQKIGCRVTNVTRAYDVEGEVYVLSTNRRMELAAAPSAMTQAQVVALMDTIREHPDTKLMGAEDFRTGKSFYAVPRDTGDYHEYAGWLGTETADEYGQHVAAWPTGATGRMPMSVIWMVFQQTSLATNKYRVDGMGTYYARWPLDHVASTLSKPVPVAPQAALAKATQVGSTLGAIGHTLESVAEGAMGLGRGLGRAYSAATAWYGATQALAGNARLLALGA